MVWTIRWRNLLNRLTLGLACCALGVALVGAAVVVNADLVAFQAAHPCADGEPGADGCYTWQSGRVTATGVRKLESGTGPGVVEAVLTLDLPVGQRTVSVRATDLPPGRPRVGDSVEAKLWHGKITDVRLAGVTTATDVRPAGQLLLLVEYAGAAFIIGLICLVAYLIDRRAGYL
jgi:hypothetical protein